MYNSKDYQEKNDFYYDHARSEMLKFIPLDATIVLDVGCASGNFGQLIKEKINCIVWGIEPDPTVAKRALEKLDKVYTNLFDDTINFGGQKFDCIIFNDVLEHLVDPYSVLQLCKKHLTKNGVIVSSIPNFRFQYTFRKILFQKDWMYENAGVLDKTHLRFFTSKSIIRMFQDEGYTIVEHEGINPWAPRLFRLLNFILFNFIDDMRYAQFATVAKLNNI